MIEEKTIIRPRRSGIKKNNLIINLLVGVVIVGCTLLYKHKVSLYFSIAALFFFFVDLYFADNTFFWKYINLIFNCVFYVVGVFVCEVAPIYLSEIGTMTHFKGSLAPLTLYYWLFFTILRVVDSRISKRIEHAPAVKLVVSRSNVNNVFFKYGRIIIVLFGIAMFLPIARNPAFLMRMGRFSYARDYLPRLITRIAYYPIYLSPLLVCPILKKNTQFDKKSIRMLVICYVPYILFLLWAGHKFGSFWFLLYSIAIPVIFKYGKNKISIKSVILILLFAVGLFFFLIMFYLLRGLTFSQALYNLGWRTSAQGELWWSIFRFDNRRIIRLDLFGEELSDIFNSLATGGAERHYGVYKLMSMFGNKNVMERYLGASSRLSAGGFELPYYFFSYLSFLILPLLYTPVFSVLTNRFIKSSMNGEVISSVCFLVLLKSFYGATTQGDWINFIAIDTLMCLIIIFSRALLVKKRKRRLYPTETLS